MLTCFDSFIRMERNVRNGVDKVDRLANLLNYPEDIVHVQDKNGGYANICIKDLAASLGNSSLGGQPKEFIDDFDLFNVVCKETAYTTPITLSDLKVILNLGGGGDDAGAGIPFVGTDTTGKNAIVRWGSGNVEVIPLPEGGNGRDTSSLDSSHKYNKFFFDTFKPNITISGKWLVMTGCRVGKPFSTDFYFRKEGDRDWQGQALGAIQQIGIDYVCMTNNIHIFSAEEDDWALIPLNHKDTGQSKIAQILIGGDYNIIPFDLNKEFIIRDIFRFDWYNAAFIEASTNKLYEYKDSKLIDRGSDGISSFSYDSYNGGFEAVSSDEMYAIRVNDAGGFQGHKLLKYSDGAWNDSLSFTKGSCEFNMMTVDTDGKYILAGTVPQRNGEVTLHLSKDHGATFENIGSPGDTFAKCGPYDYQFQVHGGRVYWMDCTGSAPALMSRGIESGDTKEEWKSTQGDNTLTTYYCLLAGLKDRQNSIS